MSCEMREMKPMKGDYGGIFEDAWKMNEFMETGKY